jgi:hypothetical protein
VHHRTLSSADLLPYLAKPTVGTWEPLAHQTLSGAHRTVRCPPPDRWLGHVSRADRAADRWPGRPLAHRTVRCTPDSPVNYSRTPLITSREQQVRLSQPGAPDTVRCGSLSLFGEADHCRFLAVGAPDTVRCPLLTVGSATRRARILRPIVGLAYCWLTGQSGEF